MKDTLAKQPHVKQRMTKVNFKRFEVVLILGCILRIATSVALISLKYGTENGIVAASTAFQIMLKAKMAALPPLVLESMKGNQTESGMKTDINDHVNTTAITVFTVLNAISMAMIVMPIVRFCKASAKVLEEWKPIKKFFALKMVLFFSVVLKMLFTILNFAGVFPEDKHYHTFGSEEFEEILTNFIMICLISPLTIAMRLYFNTTDYLIPVKDFNVKNINYNNNNSAKAGLASHKTGFTTSNSNNLDELLLQEKLENGELRRVETTLSNCLTVRSMNTLSSTFSEESFEDGFDFSTNHKKSSAL
eukprot:Pgem_evm1s12247